MLHLVIRGRVQGVGFRWFVREEAQGLGLAGWVRNRPDGAVEVVAEGRTEALEAFRERLRKGPPGADVKSLEPVAGGVDVPPANPFTIVR